MNDKILEIKLNPHNINSIEDFVSLKPRYENLKKEGYFLRHIGCDEADKFCNRIKNMDVALNEEQKRGYLRLNGLSMPTSREITDKYAATFDIWSNESEQGRLKLKFPFEFKNELWESTQKKAYERVLEIFGSLPGKNSQTIVRNFGVKIFFWMYSYLPKLFLDNDNFEYFPKFVFCGNIKDQEYLFLYFLVLLGCDVIIINTSGDINVSGSLLSYTALTLNKNMMNVEILPLYEKKSVGINPIKPIATKTQKSVTAKPAASFLQEAEKDYESLACLAKSVVMISAYNDKEECFCTGSGVIINTDGYILTNCHVIQGAAYFGVRLEESEEIYYTSAIIKYHNINDLALIKIDITAELIPLYKGTNPLARGQKVVAIGSPLGLFNSVSDGIISGFRTVREVPMIQFTAPISSGSSGGALLDLQGRLIGIITAGFDNGQNLNLAVDYKTILPFIRGFLKEGN